MSSSSSSSSSLPPVVPPHCLSVPVLYELVRGEEEHCRVWFRDEMNQIPDPLIDSLFHGLIMSSSSSAVPRHRLTVSELCKQLEGQKVEMSRVLTGEMDRVVNTLFERLINKLRTNEDGGDRAQVGNLLDKVESYNAQSHQVKREIEEENEMKLKNVMDKATQTNEQIEDCVKREIKVEFEDGEMLEIKKEEDEEDGETQINDIEGLAEDNQSGDDDGSRSGENGPMDWVKQEIKEEEEDETNEVDLDNANEGGEADEVNRMSMNNLNGQAATDIDTLFDRSMRDEVELGEPERSNLVLITSDQTQNRNMSNASTSSNEPSNRNLTNLVDQEEGQVNNNIQHQFDETNNTAEMIEQEDGDGETDLNDMEQSAQSQAGDDESRCMENAPMDTTPAHLTRQSQANINKSARHDKRKLKVPQAHNELTNRDNQHVNDEVTSRHVKRPKMDTTQANNAQAEVTRHYPRQATDEVQSNQDRPHEEGDRMESGHQPIGQDIATASTTNPTQPNLAQPNRHWQCPQCPKSFDRNFNLQRHLLVHSGERPFACDQCGKRFSQVVNLSKHQLIHQNIKLFRCNQCEKQFTRKDHLDAHLLTHSGERPFECRHCEMSFTRSDARKRHEQAIHLHVKPHRCKQCGFTATHRSAIIRHIRVGHFGLPRTIKEQQTLNIIDDRDPRELLEKV